MVKLPQAQKILLQGYIGHANFGDDLLFDIAIKSIEKVPNVEISVIISKEGLQAEYLYKYWPKLNIIRFRDKVPILFYKNFDKIFFIGGGVFFDYKKKLSTPKFCIKFLSNFIRYNIPAWLGTRYGGIGLGIGPYYSKKTKILHSQIIKNFDFLGVRDKVSYELARSMGIETPLLSNDLSLKVLDEVDQFRKTTGTSQEVIICPRSYSHNTAFEKHIEELIHFSKHLEEKDYRTHWVFLQDDNTELLGKLRKNFRVTVWNPSEMTILNFIQLFNNVKLVVSSRMHSIFLAGMLKTPFIAISLHQKLLFASKLFYDDPVMVDPLATLDDYKEAFHIINRKTSSLERAYKEKLIIEDLDLSLNKWFQIEKYKKRINLQRF